jgi:hypothetical protein
VDEDRRGDRMFWTVVGLVAALAVAFFLAVQCHAL